MEVIPFRIERSYARYEFTTGYMRPRVSGVGELDGLCQRLAAGA
jgi:hypothetical protein